MYFFLKYLEKIKKYACVGFTEGGSVGCGVGGELVGYGVGRTVGLNGAKLV